MLQMERTDPHLLSQEVTWTLSVAVQWQQCQQTEQNPRARRMKGFGEGGQRSLGLGSAVVESLNCRWLEKHFCGEMWILDTELDVAWRNKPELC